MERKKLILIGLTILIGASLFGIGVRQQRKMEEVQRQVADSVIRFHIRANSNTREDQKKKLQVRDAMLVKMRPFFERCKDKKTAETFLLENQSQMKKIAEQVLQRENGGEEVHISYQKEKFPLRVYGNYAFPPGVYDALRIDIGEAKGRNWWCVMYPSLCFLDETEELFYEKSGQPLRRVVSSSTYEQLLVRESEKRIKIKWRSFEIIQSCLEKLKLW